MSNSCVNIADEAMKQVDLNYYIHMTEEEEEKIAEK